MSTMALIRPPTSAEGPVLLAMHKRLYIDHREKILDADELLATQFRNFESVLAQDLKGLLRDPRAEVLVAELQGRIVGYISARVHEDARRVLPRRGEIEDWFVETEVRGNGVGQSLMQGIRKRLTERGCQVMQSSTWAENTGAIAAHERVGFRRARVIFRQTLE